jgi:hypothetical protein
MDLLMRRHGGSHRMHRSLSLTLLLALSATGLAAPPFPGGVLDSTGRTAYLASEAGLDAVELAHGDLVWQSREAQLPLLVAGDRLYALALAASNRLSIVALDLSGKADRVFKAEVNDFPRWVTTAGTPTQSFRLDWRQRRNILQLNWEAEAAAAGSPPKRAAGRVRVNLDTGEVNAAPTDLPPARAVEQTPARLEKLAVRWQGRPGGQLLVVAAEDLPGSTPGQRRQRFVLRGWDERTGKETTPRRELLSGARLTLLPDLDGKNLWLRDAAAEDVPWRVVSSLDGHLVRRVPFVSGTRQATLLGSRAYCLTAAPAPGPLEGGPRRARTLHAIDLEAGKVIWQRPLGVPAQAQ